MMISLFVSALDNFTGHSQITLNASLAPQVEQASEVAINVIEDESVRFSCQAISQSPTLNIRPPGSSFFTSILPSNLRVVAPLTFEFQNVSRSDNGTAFQCRGGGGFTDIGVIVVLRKLLQLQYQWYCDDCCVV